MTIAKEPTEKKPIPQPSWDGVRGIYRKLSNEFHVLTNSFNVDIDVPTKLHLDHLIIAIDEIDTCIDELPTKEERDAITSSLIAYLLDKKEDWSHPNETPGLATKIENLKRVVQFLKIEDEFVGAAKIIFSNTELKRHTNNENELIQFVVLEGKATAILTLSIMGIKQYTPFDIFFTNLCMLMGIADLIFDARQDYRQGFIALKPSFKLYFELFKITISDGLRLLINIPRKIQFAKYCLRFTFALMKG